LSCLACRCRCMVLRRLPQPRDNPVLFTLHTEHTAAVLITAAPGSGEGHRSASSRSFRKPAYHVRRPEPTGSPDRRFTPVRQRKLGAGRSGAHATRNEPDESSFGQKRSQPRSVLHAQLKAVLASVRRSMAFFLSGTSFVCRKYSCQSPMLSSHSRACFLVAARKLKFLWNACGKREQGSELSMWQINESLL